MTPAAAGEYRRIYREERRFLTRSLRRLAVPIPDIEDVLHDVFLVLLLRWHDYDQTRPIRPWLFGIAFRVAAARRRSESRRHATPSNAELEDRGPGPDQLVSAQQQRELFVGALARIPRDRRAVLMLRDVEGVPMQRIASQLSIPLFTAYSRLRKARAELDKVISRPQARPLAVVKRHQNSVT